MGRSRESKSRRKHWVAVGTCENLSGLDIALPDQHKSFLLCGFFYCDRRQSFDALHVANPAVKRYSRAILLAMQVSPFPVFVNDSSGLDSTKLGRFRLALEACA